MNYSQESKITGNKFNTRITSLKSFLNKYRIYPSNKKVISISKEQDESSSSDLNINSSDKQNTNNINDNNTTFEYEENEEEEEELNSDEYVSSTNLDVETNTYIKLTDTTKNNNDEKRLSNICGEKEITYPEKVKTKIINKHNNKKIKKNKENGVCNIFFNNKDTISQDNDFNYFSNDKKYKKKNNNKSGIFIHPPKSRNVENKNNSNTQDKKFIFSPDNNGGKKSLKVLREMLVKKLEHLHNKNLGTTPQSHTINMIEVKNNNDLKTVNSKLVKNDIKLSLHQRNKTAKITINNSINKNNSIDNKNISINEMLKSNQINKVKSKILKESNEQNTDNKKYHLISQTSKKLKTEGKIEKIANNKRYNRNENLYLKNNNNKSINKTVNNPLNTNHKYYKKINGVSSSNYSEINKCSSIHSSKKEDKDNYHSLKNLKTQNVKKNIKKFIFDDEFLTIIPFAIDKNVKNEKEKEKEKETAKPFKNSKNKKNNKNKNNKNNQSIKNNLNINKYKIKKIIPLNIKSHKNQLRYFNSFYPKKIKQNIFNKIANEPILTTISNNFRNNKKIEIFKNINSNIDLNQNKYNLSDKKYKKEKSSSKNKELSLNLTTENYIRNLLAFKKLRNLKNKNFKSTDFNNENNNINNNIKKENLTTRIKIDLINEENKKNAKKYITRNNNIINSNNETIHTTVNSNSINSNNYKKIKKIYLDNTTTYKALPYKCLSPNCQSIKKLMDDKKNVSKLKQIYNNKLKLSNKGRNNYNIYFSSNNSRCAGISNNFLTNSTLNSNNIIFFKKLQKESLKNNKYSNNNSNIVNYNLENLSNYSSMNKKIIVFNNVNNFNINNTNNTISEITNIKYGKNNKYISQKTHEDLGNYSSIFNKSYYKNRKKIIINRTPNCHKKNNSKKKSIDKKYNIGLLEQNIIHLDNPYIKSSSNNKTFNIINNINRHQINKNMIYKLNKNNNFSVNNTIKQLKFNNNTQISNSNDKEKKISNINHNSCVNLNLNKNKKSFHIKNKTIEVSGKVSKNHSKKSIMAM